MDIGIIVLGHKKIKPFARLLTSLSKIRPHKNVSSLSLIISLDHEYDPKLIPIIHKFNWEFSSPKIIKHEVKLGLKNHILKIGDYSSNYDAIIVLEDDLVVSPYLLEYTYESVNFYEGVSKVCGISLYTPKFHPIDKFPFIPLNDGYHNYFLKAPQSWGQIWTHFQWSQFKNWYISQEKNGKLKIKTPIPDFLNKWPDSSWAKFFWCYMIETDKYFVIPHTALSTQFGDPGVHIKTKNTIHQVPLKINSSNYQFSPFVSSKSVYDEYFEILPEILKSLNPTLSSYDFKVDLRGNKNFIINDESLILTYKFTKAKIRAFSSEMFPYEINIIHDLSGDKISLTKRSDIIANNFWDNLLLFEQKFSKFYISLSLSQIFRLLYAKIIRRFLYKSK